MRDVRSGAYIVVLGLLAGCSFNPAEPPGGGPSNPGADAGQSTVTDPDAAVVARPDAGPVASPDAGFVAGPGQAISHPTMQAPVLDGIRDPGIYQSSVTLDMETAPHTFAVNALYTFDGQVTFSSAHDATTIYLHFEVTDSQIVADNMQVVMDDAVDVYFDAAGDGQGAYGDDDHWFIVGTTGTYETRGPMEALLGPSEIIPTAGGYALELSVPKSNLGMTNQTEIGFNFALSDDDGIDTSAPDAYGLWYLPGGEHCEDCCDEEPQAWCDTSMFGSLILL